MQHLICPEHANFKQFVDMDTFRTLKSSDIIKEYVHEYLPAVASTFKAAAWTVDEDNNERRIQPTVYAILLSAAMTATSDSEQEFLAQSEPLVSNWCGRTYAADESIVEVITDVKNFNAIRVLVVVKGSGSFPYNCFPLNQFEQVMAQLMQEVALALVSNRWKREIIAGATTIDMWYIMRIRDVSETTSSAVKLSVVERFAHPITLENRNADLAAVMLIINYIASCLLW